MQRKIWPNYLRNCLNLDHVLSLIKNTSLDFFSLMNQSDMLDLKENCCHQKRDVAFQKWAHHVLLAVRQRKMALIHGWHCLDISKECKSRSIAVFNSITLNMSENSIFLNDSNDSFYYKITQVDL